MIIQTTIHYTKKPGTKTVWIEESREEEEVPFSNVKNCEESCSFFRRLGGSETLISYTESVGYVPVELISTSPDRKRRTVRKWAYTWEMGWSYKSVEELQEQRKAKEAK